jgi:hypothetical protein
MSGMPLRLAAAILCWSLLAPCTRSHVTEDDLIGRYTFRDGPRFEIEITGLVSSASDPQTNNRVQARLRRSPSGTILELESEPPRRLTKESTQAR